MSTAPKVTASTLPTKKLPGIKQPKSPTVKNTGLQGYLKASKMQPLIKTIKAQLMP